MSKATRSDARNDWLIVWRMARTELLGGMPRVTFTDGREPLHFAARVLLRSREYFPSPSPVTSAEGKYVSPSAEPNKPARGISPNPDNKEIA
jgi:hypothetical protein